MIIYKATNLINNKIYIGKTVQSLAARKGSHLCDALTHKYKSVLHDAIRKYGPENFCWEIIDKVLFSESLIELEKFYIKKLKSKIPYGYNMTDGGDGMCGCRHSDESKRKMSITRKGKRLGPDSSFYGRHHSDETREKISKLAKKRFKNKENHPCFGKHPSNETREKIKANHANVSGKNNPNFGKPRSEETKLKISNTKKSKKSMEVIQ